MDRRFPERGELVIADVERVVGYGAFVRLREYDNKQGMVSIKEFSRKWVKNPRDYLKEGQKAVLKVIRVNPERGHIDLSLKTVNDNERRNKLKEFKLAVRIEKLMELVAKNTGRGKEELYKEFGDKLIEDYGSLYDAFSAVSNGKEDLRAYIKDDELRNEVSKAVLDNITPTLVRIKGFISIHSDSGSGLDELKAALAEGEKAFPSTVEGSISYVAPPNYRIDITADDYKAAERAMKECYAAVEGYASSRGMDIAFIKSLKKAS